jgi:hypothetical protein
MNFIYNTSVEEGCCAVVFAGDLVDVACSWSLLPDLAEFLKIKGTAIETYTVFGQHDTYMYDAVGRRKTIVGSLAAAGLITILDDHPMALSNTKTLMYGSSYGQSVPEPIFSAKSILVLHAPICDQALWAGHNYLDANRFLEEHPKFDLIVCADIHRSFNISIGKRYILNTGPMLRRKADEVNQVPHFYFFDTNSWSLEKITIPHAPSEEVINREHIERERAYDRLIDQFQSNKIGSTISTANINFKDVLDEVALANKEKINKNVERLIADICGITMENVHGKQKATSGRRLK